MRKVNYRFEPGEPFPSTKMNGLILASRELDTAFRAEHDVGGLHRHIRFEHGVLVASWDGSSWVEEFSDRIAIFQGTSRTVLSVELDDSSAEIFDPQAIATFAMDDQGFFIPASVGARVSPGVVRVILAPLSNSNMVWVTMIGQRTIGGSE